LASTVAIGAKFALVKLLFAIVGSL
jgi:hypothetical protein